MNFLLRQGGIGEIEYHLETEEWVEPSSTFLNEKTYLSLLKLLVEIKKFKHMISQRNCGQFIRSSPIVKKNNRKITLVFYYFVCIEKNASQLFCTGDIENINQAIDIYEKYDKKLLSTFYLLIKFFWEKNISEEENEENIKLLIENTKKELQFLLESKNLDRKKNFFT